MTGVPVADAVPNAVSLQAILSRSANGSKMVRVETSSEVAADTTNVGARAVRR